MTQNLHSIPTEQAKEIRRLSHDLSNALEIIVQANRQRSNGFSYWTTAWDRPPTSTEACANISWLTASRVSPLGLQRRFRAGFEKKVHEKAR
jgi:hypothetical protein